MTVIVPNYFSPLEFVVSIKRLPNVQFFTQRSVIPSVNVSPVIQPTRFNQVYRTADEVNYGNLDLTFTVDEDMKNYLEIFRWIILSSFPENHGQFSSIRDGDDGGLFSDISIVVMNSKKNSNIEITYKNCMPIALSDVVLDTTQQDVIYPEATASFQYDYFHIDYANK